MGGKQVRPGQQVLLCIALLSLVSGCSYISDLRDRVEIRDAMLQGQALFAHGDFPGSLKEYQRAQSLARETSPSDQVWYNMGLIYADPRNPERDNQKALGAFQRVMTGHPESPWGDQSRIWVAALEDLARAKRTIEESKIELEKAKQVVEQSRRESEKSEHLLDQSKQEIETLKREIEKAKQVLEKSRQVDIELEKKRRFRGK